MENRIPIQLTEKAIEMAKTALSNNANEKNLYLRISIQGGGCSGYKYNLSFSSIIDENDLIYELDGLKIVTDIFTATQIPDTIIDYENGVNGSGFRFNNPNSKRTCGCSSSTG